MICLATLNTWKCDGDYLNRLDVLVKELRKTQPHILLLQEVFQSTDNIYDTSGYISEKLDYCFTSSRSRPKKRLLNNILIDSFSNVSIVSKYPILNRYVIPLPSNPEDGGREAIAAEILIDSKKILVCSVHLSHLKGGDDLRMQQLMHILNQPFMVNDYDGIFIGGDFNFIINDEYLAGLPQTKFQIEDTHVYEIEFNGPKYTFSYGKSSRKIDHILQLCLKRKKMLEISDSKIIFHIADPDYGIKASDHNGVMININI